MDDHMKNAIQRIEAQLDSTEEAYLQAFARQKEIASIDYVELLIARLTLTEELVKRLTMQVVFGDGSEKVLDTRLAELYAQSRARLNHDLKAFFGIKILRERMEAIKNPDSIVEPILANHMQTSIKRLYDQLDSTKEAYLNALEGENQLPVNDLIDLVIARLSVTWELVQRLSLQADYNERSEQPLYRGQTNMLDIYYKELDAYLVSIVGVKALFSNKKAS